MADLRLREILVEQAPDAVIFADERGVIREWNPAAERIFGFAKHEAVGADPRPHRARALP